MCCFRRVGDGIDACVELRYPFNGSLGGESNPELLLGDNSELLSIVWALFSSMSS